MQGARFVAAVTPAPLARLRAMGGLFDPRVWLLTVGQVVLSTGRGVIMPFSAIYFHVVHGFPLAVVGLAFALALPTGSLVGLAWGAVTDRIGRKPLMVAGFAGYALTTAAFAFVTTVPLYVAVNVLNSVSIAAWSPAARAMVADVTPPDRRARGYGLLYLANNLGLSVGLLLGGVLAVLFGYRALFFAEAGGALAFLAVVVLFVRESHARRAAAAPPEGALARVAHHLRDVATPLRDRAFFLFLVVSVLGGLGWSQFYLVYAPYMKGWLGFGDPSIAAVIAVNTVLVVALQVPLAAWVERRHRTRVYALANLLLAASLVMTWWAGVQVGSGLSIMLAAVAVMTVGEVLAAPLAPTIAAGLAGGEENYGKYMAAVELIWTMSGGLGSILGGLFFDAGRVMQLWWVVTAAVGLSVAGFALLARVLPARVVEPAATA